MGRTQLCFSEILKEGIVSPNPTLSTYSVDVRLDLLELSSQNIILAGGIHKSTTTG